MVQVLLNVGSNIDKEANITQALGELAENEWLTLVCRSRIYETVAMGSDGKPAKQPTFYNLAVWVETDLALPALVTLLRTIEEKQGRVRTRDKFAPRPIDLDVTFYGPNPSVVDGNQLPDPTISEFAHIACPLAEIAPQWTVPTRYLADGTPDPHSQQTVRRLADQLLKEEDAASQILRIIEIDE